MALGVSALLVNAVPANAEGRNVTGTIGPVSSCDRLLCLYWGSNFSGAKFRTDTDKVDLYGYTFENSGAGRNTPVKNNAASMACDATVLLCFSFYDEWFQGNYDYVLPQHGGNLYFTKNDGASVQIS